MRSSFCNTSPSGPPLLSAPCDWLFDQRYLKPPAARELATPVAMAAWALWVILSERRQATISAFDVAADPK
jgi:hypothetical protein